ISSTEIASASALPTASRLAGAAALGRRGADAAAPALAAALAPKVNGSVQRAPCQTGTEVFDTSAAVYVLSGMPSTPAATLATRPARGKTPVCALAAATLVVAPLAASS